MSDAQGWQGVPMQAAYVYLLHSDTGEATTRIPVNSRIMSITVDCEVGFNSDDVNTLALDWVGGESSTGTAATADIDGDGAAVVTYADGLPGLLTFAPPGNDIFITAVTGFGSPTGDLPDQGRVLVTIIYAPCEIER